jgi:hypothetical protein
LSTINTAEALISNAIRVLYLAENGNLWIGPEASGFNILDDDGNFELFADDGLAWGHIPIILMAYTQKIQMFFFWCGLCLACVGRG